MRASTKGLLGLVAAGAAYALARRPRAQRARRQVAARLPMIRQEPPRGEAAWVDVTPEFDVDADRVGRADHVTGGTESDHEPTHERPASDGRTETIKT